KCTFRPTLVDPARVPLYLAAGPSLEIYVSTESARNWLSKSLLDNFPSSYSRPEEPWQHGGCEQSEQAILLKVEGGSKASACGPKITEILIYATLRAKLKQNDPLPTPPVPSSPNQNGERLTEPYQDAISEARVHALPLSSELLYKDGSFQEPSSLYLTGSEDDCARFLNPVPDHPLDPQSLPHKRTRLNSLFEDATKQLKKARRKGGEGVAQAMANVDCLSPHYANPMGSDHTWTPDGFALPDQATGTSCSSRPASRASSSHGPNVQNKRPILSRVATIATFNTSCTTSEIEDIIEQRNKNALSRIVMAGMRIHGLQQKRPLSRARTAFEFQCDDKLSSNLCTAVLNEDEYKLVYHQTFRSVSFALRKHFATAVINQETMRDIVDQILAIFCVDPINEHDVDATTQKNVQFQAGSQKSNFDLPRGKSTSANLAVS
ncbi:hypothetical protein MMC20_006692, partial [Loxospora ochrophaea]|nr:hypothetical protein [Loxospora ochrophaea]